MKRRKRICVDGNFGTAHAAYAMSDVAFVFPITPSTSMSQHIEEWASKGIGNCLSKNQSQQRPVIVRQMQSEAGVAGALHGALRSGSLATTFTSSQGLLLLVPTLHRIVGDALPLVVHLASRAIAQDGVTIFTDHSDVYSTRGTGATIVSSHSVQEAADLALASHISAITTRNPVIHVLEGMELSHETTSCDLIPYQEIISSNLVPMKELLEFRNHSAISPFNPKSTGVVLGRETFWQQAESSNSRIFAIPQLVQDSFNKLATVTGRKHKLFEFAGCENAEKVIVAMGVGAQTAEIAAKRLASQGQKVGVVKVHLFRPWSEMNFLESLPKTTKKIAVLDRSYEPTASGEPLFLDVSSTVSKRRKDVCVIGGRYGIGGHDFTVEMAESVFAELSTPNPRQRFSVGIIDDVTHLSLPLTTAKTRSKKTNQNEMQCVFLGIGGDGTVSANRNTAEIVCSERDLEGMTVQLCVQYDAHKTGGVTISHLRFLNKGREETQEPLYHGAVGNEEADFVACHVPAYLGKYNVLGYLKEGGTLLLNAPWGSNPDDIAEFLPEKVMKEIAQKTVKLYIINASLIAKEAKLGGFTSTVLAAAFLKLTGIAGSAEHAAKLLKESVSASYGKRTAEGMSSIAASNSFAIDSAINKIQQVHYSQSWGESKKLKKQKNANELEAKKEEKPKHVKDIGQPLQRMNGMNLPVSVFLEHSKFGETPQGSTVFEKRGLAKELPSWDARKCIQCNRCSFVCPHSAIRPFILQSENKLCKTLATIPALGKEFNNNNNNNQLRYRLQVSSLDCTGCSACAKICPTKAITMQPSVTPEIEHSNWVALNEPNSDVVSHGPCDSSGKITARSLQLSKPLLEFAGSCAGCPQPVYAKLLTQMLGKRLVIANGIGCSTVWGGTGWSSPYTADSKSKRGPAWTCSLFENTAEYGFGITIGYSTRRSSLHDLTVGAQKQHGFSESLRKSLDSWNQVWKQDDLNTEKIAEEARKAIEFEMFSLSKLCKSGQDLLLEMFASRNLLHHQSHWIIAGDGFAHDIGFGGLDHVLSQNVPGSSPLRILILDNELYANTGGQQSKATPASAVAKLASLGKNRAKKDLGSFVVAMHPDVYVASVCYGSDPEQTVKALKEAEEHKGHSIVVAFTPCVEHQPRGGFNGATAIERMKSAVNSGYWPLYRRIPGSPVIFDSIIQPTSKLDDFIESEGRFASLSLAVGTLEATHQRELLKRHISSRNSLLKAIK